jgi:hypothetical protein
MKRVAAVWVGVSPGQVAFNLNHRILRDGFIERDSWRGG